MDDLDGFEFFSTTTTEHSHLFNDVFLPDLALDGPKPPQDDAPQQQSLQAPLRNSGRGGAPTSFGEPTSNRTGPPSRKSVTDTSASPNSHIRINRPWLHSVAPTFELSQSQEGQQQSRAEACVRSALSTLDFFTTYPCQRAERSRPAAITGLDSALQANRAAKTIVQDILSCSCASNASVVLVLALILHRGIDVLQGILRTQHDNEDGAAFNVPLAFGGFILTGEARSRVIKQVLKDELADVSKVLQRVEERLVSNEDGPLLRSKDELIRSVQARIDEMNGTLCSQAG